MAAIGQQRRADALVDQMLLAGRPGPIAVIPGVEPLLDDPRILVRQRQNLGAEPMLQGILARAFFPLLGPGSGRLLGVPAISLAKLFVSHF
jgi:hypothetical protein